MLGIVVCVCGQGIDVFAHNKKGPLTYDVPVEALLGEDDTPVPDVYADSVREIDEHDIYEKMVKEEVGNIAAQQEHHPCMYVDMSEEINEECMAVMGEDEFDFPPSCMNDEMNYEQMEEYDYNDLLSVPEDAAWVAEMASERNMSQDEFLIISGLKDEL